VTRQARVTGGVVRGDRTVGAESERLWTQPSLDRAPPDVQPPRRVFCPSGVAADRCQTRCGRLCTGPRFRWLLGYFSATWPPGISVIRVFPWLLCARGLVFCWDSVTVGVFGSQPGCSSCPADERCSRHNVDVVVGWSPIAVRSASWSCSSDSAPERRSIQYNTQFVLRPFRLSGSRKNR